MTTVPRLVAGALPDGVVCVEVDDPGFTSRSMLLARIGRPTEAATVVRSALFHEARAIAGAPLPS